MRTFNLLTPEKVRDRVKYDHGARSYMVPYVFSVYANDMVDAFYNDNPYFVALFKAICRGDATPDEIETLSVEFENNVRSIGSIEMESHDYHERMAGNKPN